MPRYVKSVQFSREETERIQALANKNHWSFSKTINILAMIGMAKHDTDEGERARLISGDTQFDPSYRVNL